MAKKVANLGMPIGISNLGLPYPVLYDPHYPVLINRPPVTFISGSPGSGKTFAALLMATQSSICGKVTFVLDPKGDFVSLKSLQEQGIIGHANIWSIIDPITGNISQENHGILDPTRLGSNPKDNAAMTIDVIQNLVSDISPKQNAVLRPIVSDVTEKQDSGGFIDVVNQLNRHKDDEVRSLGQELGMILNLPISQLLVKPRYTQKKVTNTEDLLSSSKGGLTVVSLFGLELPNEGKDPSSYTAKEKVSVVIMSLLANQVLEIMKTINKGIQKTLIVDEAWSIMGNENGSNMIQNVALLGRSINMAAILISQSPSHLITKSGKDLNNTISVRLAFRNDSDKDNSITAKDMKLPEASGWDEVLSTLETGQCLMQDANKRNGIVHIAVPDVFARAFDTNPMKYIKNQAG